jgi:hypothetical protein
MCVMIRNIYLKFEVDTLKSNSKFQVLGGIILEIVMNIVTQHVCYDKKYIFDV